MENLTTTPLGAARLEGAQTGGVPAFQGLDVRRLGMEVANELGVDPGNLGAYGLSEEKIRAYETQLHSGTQRGSR